MNKKLAGLIILIAVMTTSTFANNIEKNSTRKAVVTLSTLYKDVKDVTWENRGDFIKASFNMDEHQLFAFFTPEGELIGVCKNLSSSELPVFLQAELSKYRANGWITDLFELTKDEETSYFVTIESADQKVILKSADFASWLHYSKIKK
jgi:hypothetical protein